MLPAGAARVALLDPSTGPRKDRGDRGVIPSMGPNMTRARLTTLLAGAAVPLAGIAIAGCGGGGNNNNNSNSDGVAPPKTADGKPATIGIDNSSLGTILVDSEGRTVYLFRKDAGTKSACSGECARDWPPVRATGNPTSGSGLTGSMVSTTARTDGKPQVTYNGHPLYRYEGDHKAGDTNGQGLNAFGAPWYAVSSGGNEVTAKASSSGRGVGGY
jgi:predicted lipoprotein with Yx(FWY)xxD motif